MSANYPEYAWYPSALANASHSAEYLAIQYAKYLFSSPSETQKTTFVQDSLEQGLGVFDYTIEELANLVKEPMTALYQYAEIVSRRSQTGWSTHGHSAADVNIYSSDPKAAMALIGNHENTEVGDFLRDYLDVDVEAVTRETPRKRCKPEGHRCGPVQKSAGWALSLMKDSVWDDQNHLVDTESNFDRRHVLHGRACGCEI